ncbi:MAG: TlpA family protein disulfide reductase [Kiritimatiellae bacterium]|nr:TlpA family protein disulfide reductase [Kiritimatiellia bacterium]
MNRFIPVALAILFAAAALPAAAQSPDAPADFSAARAALLSRLQGMGHGYYSEAEWADVMSQVRDLSDSARASDDPEAILDAALVEASVLGDMRHQFPEALRVLRDARAALDASTDTSRLFVKESEILAQTGDSAAIERLIADYKASRHYRPEAYAWSGGNGPGDPLYIARPNASGGASVPLTVMEKALRRAASAPGTAFPDALVTDLYGRPIQLSAYRGRVLLVDFFARGWKLWDDNLAAQRDVFLRCHDQGFDILGICLETAPDGLEALALPWPVVASAPELTRALGIFGQSTSYLLDRNGNVIARDLRGQDLSFAVRRALEAP